MALRNWYGRSSRSGGLTISEAAATYGVTSRTLRFYESRNLLSPKRVGNVRVYSANDEARLQLIIKGKKLGFSLAEIASFLPFWTPRASTNPAPALQIDIERIERQLRALVQKRNIVVAAIEELKAREAELEGDNHRSTTRPAVGARRRRA